MKYGTKLEVLTRRQARRKQCCARAMAAAAEPSTSAAATIAFVYTHKLSSSTYRGQLVARALNQSYLRCGESIGDRFFDLIVHLKLPCASLLPHGRSHVIDHIDALPDRYRAFQRLLANFSGQIFNTDEHLREQCCTRACVVIPHHCNLPCATNFDRSNLTTVGLIGWTQASLGIGAALRRANITPVIEPKGRWHTFGSTAGLEKGRPADICRFFNRLRVAVAWNDEQERGYDPAQRFTNAVCLGIPTIGYARQASFRAYGGAFLCEDVACVQRMLKQIDAGTHRAAFEPLARTVIAHVSWAATRQRYLALFAALLDDERRGRRRTIRRLFRDQYDNSIPNSPRCPASKRRWPFRRL